MSSTISLVEEKSHRCQDSRFLNQFLINRQRARKIEYICCRGCREENWSSLLLRNKCDRKPGILINDRLEIL